MAKKKEKLSLEELVEKALVPREEQPLDIATNWIWTYIGNLAFVTKLAGFEYTKYIAPNLVPNGVPLFKGKNVKNGELIYDFESFIPQDISDGLIRSKVNKKCLLTPYVGAIGNVAIFNGDMECHLGSNVGKIEVFNTDRVFLIEEYMLYYLRSDIGYKELTKHKKATAQESISIEAIRNVCVPLPPFAEQQRIVDIIEQLFEKLDTAKELVQNALDFFENRKAAILHKAFTGEFTAKWREEKGVSLDEWEETYLGDIVTYSKEKYDPAIAENKAVYIGLEHIEKNGGIINKGISDEIKSLKTVFRQGDILYGKLRPYLNKHDIVNFDGICSTDILVIRVKPNILNRYINYMLNVSNFIDYAVANSNGINLPRISEKEMSRYKLKTPSIEEQQEIVRILDNLLDNEQRAKELCDVIEKIDLMKKAILARAFRGELGTNDPEEESAVLLLEEVLKEKI